MFEKKLKFAFLGSGEFSSKVLEVLFQNKVIPDILVTLPDKPKGRGLRVQANPAKIWAEKNNIKITTNLEILVNNYEIFIVAAYGKIIPKKILDIPKHGTINVHPSLLPKFRGASPIQSFILSNEKKTGVTIVLLDEKIDHGPIIIQRKLITDNLQLLNYKELEEKLAELGGNLLVEIIPKYLNNEIKPQKQDHLQATFTKKITKQDGLINLETDSPEIIYKKIRAFTPWPSVYTFIKGKRIIITKAELINSKLKILKIKPEGKNEMDFKGF
jgi:methionyl-tRNA formyltransferase